MVRCWVLLSVCLLAACEIEAEGDGVATRDLALRAVADASHTITAVAPGDSAGDLEFLGDYIGDARVVGLGEATHGTREFFQLKHRVIQYLVERKGFRTFAIEAVFEPSIRIDRYIKGGEGDVEALVNGLGFWTWDTEEVIELVEWMRAYNARGGDPLNFYGFDVQGGGDALKRALAFVAAHARDETAALRAGFGPYLSFDELEGEARELARTRLNSPANLTGMHRAVTDLSLYIERNEALLTASAGADDYRLAQGAARVAVWWLAMALQPDEWTYLRSTSATDVRDRGMADMVHWIRAVGGDEERIALWAHNAHVGKISDADGDRMMGMLLENELGSDYYAIGFAFERGSFQAFRPATEEQAAVFMEHTVGAADEDSVDGLLADVGSDVFFVDLGRASRAISVRKWLGEPRRMRWTGARYSDELEALHPPVPVLAMFDGLIFVRDTTRARPSARTSERFGLEITW